MSVPWFRDTAQINSTQYSLLAERKRLEATRVRDLTMLVRVFMYAVAVKP